MTKSSINTGLIAGVVVGVFVFVCIVVAIVVPLARRRRPTQDRRRTIDSGLSESLATPQMHMTIGPDAPLLSTHQQDTSGHSQEPSEDSHKHQRLESTPHITISPPVLPAVSFDPRLVLGSQEGHTHPPGSLSRMGTNKTTATTKSAYSQDSASTETHMRLGSARYAPHTSYTPYTPSPSADTRPYDGSLAPSRSVASKSRSRRILGNRAPMSSLPELHVPADSNRSSPSELPMSGADLSPPPSTRRGSGVRLLAATFRNSIRSVGSSSIGPQSTQSSGSLRHYPSFTASTATYVTAPQSEIATSAVNGVGDAASFRTADETDSALGRTEQWRDSTRARLRTMEVVNHPELKAPSPTTDMRQKSFQAIPGYHS